MLPNITFSTIYDFLVDHKILLRKVSYIENALDSREDALIGKASLQSSDTLSNVTDNPTVKNESWHESVEYTRSLHKAYWFFKNGTFKVSGTTLGIVNQILMCSNYSITIHVQRSYLPWHPDHQGIKCPCDHSILHLPSRTVRVLTLLHLCIA